jgi:hypothetical protein
MRVALAAIAGTLIVAVYMILISPPLQEVGQRLETFIR